jgi:predicted Zn-dependent protease
VRRRLGRVAAAVVLAGLAAACATPQPVQDIGPGEQPALDSDEAGLWMAMGKAEQRLKTSGKVIDNRKLNKYVRGIVCRLSREYCKHIRVYIVRSPGFNASMAPNGALHVWSGLILRAQSEAQLAYVLGHEIAHYQQRHTLKRWRDLRAKTDGLVFFQFATAVAGLGFIGDLTALATLGSHSSFNRDQERQADDAGLRMIMKAGYDPRQAAKIWDLLIEEKKAAEEPDQIFFFATHPASEERRDTLAATAKAAKKGKVGSKRLNKATARFRGEWLRDELRKRDYARTEVLIRQQRARGRNPGMLHFMQGELYRLRDGDGDEKKAVAAYKKALKGKDAPPEVYRSLGLVYWSMEQSKAARKAFRSYIRRHPKAEDRAMVESYIQEIEESRS